MANLNETRVCRLHELAVRDDSGHSRAFHYGERVVITPALAEAIGDYLVYFEPVDSGEPIQDFSNMAVESSDVDHRQE